MDTLTIASSDVVAVTAGFPHGSLGLAEVFDTVAAMKTISPSGDQAIEKKVGGFAEQILLRASGEREWVLRKGRAADRSKILDCET
ncbi:hypothetical protein [Bradyrhizobium sp. BWC-3-1]|uniref:hypothetical protein n=1 Tax=Bradyrhizobium sp. BWC-3-1 TaxID=3080012 RepID=UPI00293F5146|nr:hypothetical protein [Bradyrhizobium sp. BWC-3-1]WOH56073.1 hypothetical protein RX329_27855 [Bradyrhizobium sp. BWC-3-1]